MNNETRVAVFGGGCFWCTEAVFDMLRGIISVKPGYACGMTGSPQAAPTYEQVCSGRTGHAEVIKIEFDPAQISYRDLLTVFFATHDVTTLNRQPARPNARLNNAAGQEFGHSGGGNDVGTQYRSIILCSTEDQKKEAEAFIKELNESSTRGNPVVTEVKPLEAFYEAEGYHHSYYKNNSSQSYCQVVIAPKLQKVQQKFAELLKSSEKK